MREFNFDELVFYTINPHYKDYSLKTLVNNFKHILQQYYKQTLGVRYHKKKSEQFKFSIFQEETKNIIKEPHLHIVIEIADNKREKFFEFMNTKLQEMYPSLTYDIQPITNTQEDIDRLTTYCQKEDLPVLTNEDLW